MNRQTLPLNEILVENRQRIDYGDIDELAQSLSRFGLIQPIIINQDRRLIAGGRRFAAATKLGWQQIDVVFRETLSIDELHELELEENLRRKEETWQERCVHIKTIHDLKSKRSALEGSKWGQRETAEMLGIKGASNVNYALRVADLIIAKDTQIIQCESLNEALKLLLRREEDRILARLNQAQGEAAKSKSILPSSLMASFGIANPLSIAPSESKPLISDSSAKDAALEKYLSNPLNDPNTFDEYWNDLQSLRSKSEQHSIATANTICLSNKLYCCDSIDFMSHPDCKDKFDAIITDIPYGIDMDMLNQGNDGHAFQDIDTVLTEHTIEGNEALFAKFFPAAYHCLKPNSYCITWCDIMQWQLMFDLATQAGFKCQRWPITWVKTSPCMNQSANVNFTKTTEIAIVCRKGTCSLSKPNIPSHIVGGHDVYKDTLGHPFVKPFIIWEHLIRAVTLEGHTVLEPFAGRGSGVISLARLGRNYIGCELNVEHFNALMENMKQYYLALNPNTIFA